MIWQNNIIYIYKLVRQINNCLLYYNIILIFSFQSHISESVAEIDFVKDLFSSSYAQAYDNAGLLTNKVRKDETQLSKTLCSLIF